MLLIAKLLGMQINRYFIYTFALFLVSSISWAADTNVALLYSGPGACPENCVSAATDRAQAQGFKVRLVTEKNWPADLFDGARLWIQPGGQSKVVAQALSHEQKDRIRKFIAGGGGYVGFCAGAFFASQAIVLSDGTAYGAELLGILGDFCAFASRHRRDDRQCQLAGKDTANVLGRRTLFYSTAPAGN